MKLLLCWILCAIVAGLHAHSDDHCTYNGKRVRCWGHSMAKTTAKIPNDTVSYQYTGLELNIELGLVDFSHLPNLTKLYINTEYDDFAFVRSLHFNASQQAVFKPLSRLQTLIIHIDWNMSHPMPEMFMYLPRLHTLNLTFSREINYTSLQQSFKGLNKKCVFKALLLKNTQTFQILQNGLKLNLSNFLEPLAHCPLEVLDLSYNGLKTVYPGLLRFAPNLKTLYITNNMLTPLINSAFFFEVLLHPSIETADFKLQGHGINPPNIPPLQTKKPHFMANHHSSSRKMKRESTEPNALAAYLFPRQPMDNRLPHSSVMDKPPLMLNGSFSGTSDFCLDQIRVNVCKIFEPYCNDTYDHFRDNRTAFCRAFEVIFDESFGGIPCKFFPNITDLLAEQSECGGCYRIPSAGNIRNLRLSENIYYDQTILEPSLIDKTKCFLQNKIEVLGLSNNYPFGFPDFDKSLWQPVTGFPNLKTVQLANCGLKQPYFNITATFPNLQELDFSKNKLNLQRDRNNRSFIGPPTVRVFYLTANALLKTPEDTLKTMTALTKLHMDSNFLEGFMMDLTKLPNLILLNLHNNLIKVIPKNMTDQFDAHAQRMNRTVKIDLGENPLLCTCNERDFVRWLQTEKHQNLHFVGMENYTCLNDQSNVVKIVDVNLNHMAVHCLSVYVYVAISAGAAVILAGFIVACGTCAYRKRWWFRYRYYLITKMYRQQQQREEAHRNYQYDAFVSYNSRDELWINEELQPKLEDEFGLKLCLHERDFVLGGNIIEQISSSIENSRKTLLILSPNFLASTWCHWEMNLAHNRLLSSGQDVLLLAILSPMSKVKMSRVLKDLLEKKTYVMWTQDRDGQKLFWEKLQQAIRADRIEPFDLEDGHEWEDSRPLLVNEQASGQTNAS